MALVLFMFVPPVFLFPLTPLSSLYSRANTSLRRMPMPPRAGQRQ